MKRQLETRLTSLEKEILSSYHKGNRITSHSLTRESSEDTLRSNFHFLSTDSLTGMTKGFFSFTLFLLLIALQEPF